MSSGESQRMGWGSVPYAGRTADGSAGVGRDVAGASAGPEAVEGHISVTSLRPGMRLAQDVYDRSGVLLLAAGTRITPRFLDLLQRRRIHSVIVRSASGAVGAATTARGDALDTLLTEQLAEGSEKRSAGGDRRLRLPVGLLMKQLRAGLQKHCVARIMLADTCETLKSGRKASKSGLAAIVRDFAEMAAIDADVLPLIASMQTSAEEYLYDHCVNVSMISMVIAFQLGMNRDQVIEVGLGGLLADVGMLRVPKGIRLARRSLTSDEWLEILRHPAHTVDMLERLEGLPLPARFVGYQAHERSDGSGYPRRRSGMLIHPYAKIVAVADAYVAMTGPRPYREALSPYRAAKEVLLENSRNKFDREIARAFLDSVALFPVGSTVELVDGRRGTVLRSNPGLHTRPIVVELGAQGAPTGRPIDLSKESELKVVKTGPPRRGSLGIGAWTG